MTDKPPNPQIPKDPAPKAPALKVSADAVVRIEDLLDFKFVDVAIDRRIRISKNALACS